MTTVPSKPLKFGAFVPPQNVVGLNPTLAIRRTIELAVHLEQLGFDEIWFGEHHSGGAEIVASPELIVAAAAERTKSIRLGTGVISLPYHNPFAVADRIVQLSHMTRGRVMFGAGPGQLPTDAKMLGIDPTQLRPRMEDALGVILQLLDGQTVTARTDWYELNEAQLQLVPYGDLNVSVVATISPSGPKLAGRHGLGILSLAATDPTGVEQLARHWSIVQDEAEKSKRIVVRDDWRLMGPMHVARSVEEAVRQCEYGLRWQQDYFSHITPMALEVPDTTAGVVEFMNRSGRGVFGTPEMAAQQIQRLIDRSGGFGTYLFQGVDFADWRDTLRSYELFAEEVMPLFNGHLAPVQASYDLVMGRESSNRADITAGRAAAEAQYQQERGNVDAN